MSFQKDRRGKELIKLLCIPDHNGEFCKDPGLLEEMYAYSKQDVIAERFAAMATPPLTDTEHSDWVLVEKKNDRGLKVDKEFASAAALLHDEEVEEISNKISEVTGGVVTSPRQFVRIKDYLAPCMEQDDDVRKIMTRVDKNRQTGDDVCRIVCDTYARLKLLDLEKQQPGRLPEKVRILIELLQEAGSSSVHKYHNMVQRAGEGDRVRGAYIFSGASTGRSSSVGLQVHNLPSKNVLKHLDMEETRKTVLKGEPLTDSVIAVLKTGLKYSIMAAPGHTFAVSDYRNVEAVMLPYLAADPDAGKVLKVFSQQFLNPDLPDIYVVQASKIFNVHPNTISKDQRQIGKVCVLSLGFGGSVKAFQSMARSFKIVMSDGEVAKIVKSWRLANPWAQIFWDALESAARSAVKHPPQMFEVGRVKYCCPEKGAPLICELPSGRMLTYPNPKLDLVDGPAGASFELSAIKAQWKPKRGETKWGRINLYGGLLAENCTQAAANCLLRNAMRLADEDGWPIVATTHDEIVIEVRDDEIEDATEGLEAIMLTRPDWAADLPLACETWSGKRYQK